MPAGYEAIRDHFLDHKDPKTGKAMSLKDAKKHAAMIWNSTHAGTGQTVGNWRKKRKTVEKGRLNKEEICFKEEICRRSSDFSGV